MRVVAGEFKGRILKAPKGARVRPTSDRVKVSLFAILRHDIVGARVLDLFAGSGNLGIEALSRGADSALFVDQNPISVRIIRENLRTLGISERRAQIHRGEVLDALEELASRHRLFDVVFLDPPYGSTLAHETLQALGMTAPILSEEGVVVVEHARRVSPSDFYGHLTRVRLEHYGDSTISFFRHVTPVEMDDVDS